MSPVRWLRAFAVVGATALLLASSCSWQLGPFIPKGVPPPPGAVVPPVDTHAKGRPADQLHAWAAQRAPAMHIPVTALEAYGYAARVAEVENPNCHIAWTTLAGIGQVESHHGTYHHATLFPNGDVRPPIRGVVLDGTNGTMRIIDSAAGGMDGEPDTVRAMGPMQFIPETWREYGVDANNDGVDQRRQHRRCRVVRGGLFVLAREGSRHRARVDHRAVGLQRLRRLRPRRSRLGYRLCGGSLALTKALGYWWQLRIS